MEEIFFKPLSEGLGFYDPPRHFDMSGSAKKTDRSRQEWASSEPRSPSRGSLQNPQNSNQISVTDLQKKNFLPSEEWPDSLLSGTLDLDDSQNYEHLISLLEKPWLGKKSTQMPSVSPVKTTIDRTSQEGANSEPRSPLEGSLQHPQRASQVTVSAPGQQDISNKNILNSSTLNENKDKKSKIPSLLKKTFYFSLKAYLVDAFVISLLFFPPFVLFVFLTQPAPIAVLPSVWFQMLLVFLCFSQIYYLLCRLFCFETYGETLAKIRLCHLDSSKEVHPYRLLLRFFISCATGFIFLPLLSLIFRRDFMARLTGLYFQKIEINLGESS